MPPPSSRGVVRYMYSVSDTRQYNRARAGEKKKKKQAKKKETSQPGRFRYPGRSRISTKGRVRDPEGWTTGGVNPAPSASERDGVSRACSRRDRRDDDDDDVDAVRRRRGQACRGRRDGDREIRSRGGRRGDDDRAILPHLTWSIALAFSWPRTSPSVTDWRWVGGRGLWGSAWRRLACALWSGEGRV
jgi:hypothetical protein